jgi:hypothetical protein
MSGFNKSDNSLVNGIPARYISPETGSFGNATETNHAGTGEGTNESYSPADGIESPLATVTPDGEERSFATDHTGVGAAPLEAFDAENETPSQQIADGGDRIKHEHRDKSDQ